MRARLSFPVVSGTRRLFQANSERGAQVNRILVMTLITITLAILCACGNGIDTPPGTGSSGGPLTVQIVQSPPATLAAGATAGLAANVLNDKTNSGVTWSCAPAGACGSFNPTTTAYQITTLYTAPPVTPNSPFSLPITITATSVANSAQSASASVNVLLVEGQYAIVLYPGNGSFGMVASVTLDGNGNVTGGEADGSAGGFSWSAPSVSGTYALDATGHGNISLSLQNTTCCGTLQQTHGITATSSSHLVIAEEDQFNGLTIAAVGSMDLQTAGPAFSGSQVSGGYSFTLAGYSHAAGENASWGGIFTADGSATAATSGNITAGIFDENVGNNGGGSGYNSEVATPAAGLPFTGTYTAPDANGRGLITLSTSPDTPGPCGASPLPTCTEYVYYMVTPEVLQLTSSTNVGNAGNTGTAFGQGAFATAANDTNAALTGAFIFTGYGFGDNNNGGDSSAVAGQFASDGNGNIVSGIMDLNVADGGSPAPSIATTDIPLAASNAINFSGSPRGTLATPSGQIYNVYLTDPALNLLDPNNPTGTGGALLLQANNPSAAYGNAIGLAIPQSVPAPAALSGSYALLLSNQSNLGGCCSYDGGFTGDFTVSSAAFSGEGDYQGMGPNNATLITGPVTGTFTADSSNPGHFTGTITTTPAFPLGAVGGTTPGTENVDFFVANGSQGFIVETDTIAPVFGLVEAQVSSAAAAASVKRHSASQQLTHATNLSHATGEHPGRLSGHAVSGRE
jgi:hypothetical protein